MGDCYRLPTDALFFFFFWLALKEAKNQVDHAPVPRSYFHKQNVHSCGNEVVFLVMLSETIIIFLCELKHDKHNRFRKQKIIVCVASKNEHNYGVEKMNIIYCIKRVSK